MHHLYKTTAADKYLVSTNVITQGQAFFVPIHISFIPRDHNSLSLLLATIIPYL